MSTENPLDGAAGGEVTSNTAGLRFAPDGTFSVARNQLDSCFGCGSENAGGLQLRFRLLAEGGVGTTVAVAEHMCGVDGVVHGGIQATILDEVSGVAAQLALPVEATPAPCVTAELSLRFRRGVSQLSPVSAEARVSRVEGRNIFVDAVIVDEAGEVLTSASSRWVQLTPPDPDS